jgi:hypothetical protein
MDDKRETKPVEDNGNHTWHNQQEANTDAIEELQRQVDVLNSQMKTLIETMREMLKLI